MNMKRKNISKLVLISYLVGFIGLNPIFAAPTKEVQLRGTIDDSSIIKLKGGINIDKKNETINLNLRDSDIKQVLRMIADKAGKNIVFHNSVDGKITLDLNKVTLNKAFEYVMTMSGLAYWQDGNTLIIASKSVSGGLGINKTDLRPIPIKYLNANTVANFLNNNIFSLNKPEISVNQIVITNPRTNQILILGNENDYNLAKKAIALIDVKPLMKTFNVNYADPTQLASNICMNVFNSDGSSSGSSSGSGSSSSSSASSSSASGSSSGSSSSSSSASSGVSIVCSNSSGSDSSDSSSSSASSSSSTSSTSTSTSSDSSTTSGGGFGGINFTPQSLAVNGYYVMADSDMNQLTVSGSVDQINMAEDIIKKFDKKQPQVYIEISIIELSESGSKSLQSSVIANSGSSSTTFKGGSTRLEYGTMKLSDPYYAGITGEGKWLTNLERYGDGRRNTVVAIQSLIEQRKGKVLANPRIIATNNRTSTVDITSDFVAKRTVNRSTTGNTIENIITYDIQDAGIQLSLTPKISPNGYVTLDINPSYTSQKEQVKDGTDIVATLLNKRQMELQNVRVKDGETLILGGLIQETESRSTFKIPVLGDIPILGVFFKDSSTDRTKSELILMITPKIIQEEDPVNI